MQESGFGRNTRLAVVAAIAALLAACGGGSGEGAASTTTPDTSDSSPASAGDPARGALDTGARSAQLRLDGEAVTTVAAGSSYSFTPTLSGATGLTAFSIANKPSWASFNTVTGELSGKPGSGDVGVFENIRITATNGSTSSALPVFSIEVTGPQRSAALGSATLSWNPPTEHTDGTPITNLAGYNIYVGSSADNMDTRIEIKNPGLTAYTVSDLGAGTHYFGITALSSAGIESDLAMVGSKTIM
jgi:hypothetical protein